MIKLSKWEIQDIKAKKKTSIDISDINTDNNSSELMVHWDEYSDIWVKEEGGDYGQNWIKLDYVPEEKVISTIENFIEEELKGEKYWFYKRDGESTYWIYDTKDHEIIDGFENKKEMSKELNKLNKKELKGEK